MRFRAMIHKLCTHKHAATHVQHVADLGASRELPKQSGCQTGSRMAARGSERAGVRKFTTCVCVRESVFISCAVAPL